MPKTVKKPETRGGANNATGNGYFKPGNPGGPGRGKKKPPSAIGASMLAEMERAYTTPESPDDPEPVKRFRRLGHKDLGKFTAMWQKAMDSAIEYAKWRAEEGPVAAAATQAGEQEVEVEELIARLLKEWEAEDARARSPELK